MSTVLRFRSQVRRGTERKPLRQICEIVIFPGVRVERHAEPDGVAPVGNEDLGGVAVEAPVSRTC